MIAVTINAKTGAKTITDLGPHPKDYDWLKELAAVIYRLNKEGKQ